jgi:CubicO group peptidase (beta-lactamase class C family)
MKKILVYALLTYSFCSATVLADSAAITSVTPVTAWKSGFTDAQAEKLRKQYNVMHMQRGDDVGVYMFHNLSEVMAAKRVARGGIISTLDYAIHNDIENLTATSELGELTLKQLMQSDEARFQGIVVAQHGKIIYEAYPGMQESDSHVWMSAVKTVTALLVELLREQGLIDTDKAISHYLTELKGTEWDHSKLIDLLNMASGMDIIESAETLANPNSPAARGFRLSLANRGSANDSTNNNTGAESLLTIMQSAKRLSPSGTVFDYSTFNTQMLGLIIERVTERNFADVFSELVWSKAGMEGDGLVAISPSGETLNGGIFSSRLRDMTRYGMLFTPSWHTVTNEKIVSDAFIAKIQDTAPTQTNFMKGDFGPKVTHHFGEQPSHNAHQWDAVFTDGDFYKAGRNGQCLYVSPSRDLVVTWFSATLDNKLFYPAYARKIALTLGKKSPGTYQQ